MRLFFDRNLSFELAVAANALLKHRACSAVSAYDRYPRDPGDVAWIRELADEGEWGVVTADRRILRDPIEQATWRRSGLTTFFLAGGWFDHPLLDQGWHLIRWLPRFLDHLGDDRAGTGLFVPFKYSPGQLRRIYSPQSSPSG